MSESVVESLIDFCNGLEALAVNLRRQIQGLSKPSNWDPGKIVWQQAEGFKGPFEKSEDFNNLEFKAMLKDLVEHGGKLTRDSFFYWVYQNGSTVGRKRRVKG